MNLFGGAAGFSPPDGGLKAAAPLELMEARALRWALRGNGRLDLRSAWRAAESGRNMNLFGGAAGFSPPDGGLKAAAPLEL